MGIGSRDRPPLGRLSAKAGRIEQNGHVNHGASSLQSDAASSKTGRRREKITMVAPIAMLAIALGGTLLAQHLPTQLMHSIPSSLVLTPKSDPFSAPRLPHPLRMAALQAEEGLDVAAPVVLRPIYDFPSFDSELLDQQLRRYAAFLEHSGAPDVLIVGSSRALQGVDPAALREGLMAQGYSSPTVYNFSINGATAQVIEVLLRKILTPDQLPDLVIWADGSRAFNSGRRDATYAQIAASQGYQALARGDRPIQFRPEIRSQIQGPLPESVAVCVDVPPTPAPHQSASFQVPVKSLCHPWSEANLLQMRRPDSGDAIAAPKPLVTLNGAEATDHPLRINELGFAPIDTRFDPATYYQQFPRVAGAFDGSYRPFSLDGVQTDSTRAIARFLAERNIPLAFVSLPLTADYLDNTRQYYEGEFRQYMQALAQAEGFGFVDLSQAWLYENSYFQDPSHINRVGAAAVANALATHPTIPFPGRR
jgi:hypothetical protein